MLLGVGSSTTIIADKQSGSLAVEPVYCIKLRCYLHAWIAQPYVLLFKFDKCREIWRESTVTDTSHYKLVDSFAIDRTYLSSSLAQSNFNLLTNAQ